MTLALQSIFSEVLGRYHVPPGCADKYWRELQLSNIAGVAVLPYAVQMMGFLRELTVKEVLDVQEGNCVSYIPEDLLLLDDQFQLAEGAAQVERLQL